MVFSTGYDFSDNYKFGDGLAKLYTILAGVWTVILVVGAIILVHNRNLPFLRIRNIPLIISTVFTLHVYWVLCMIAYGLNGYWPCRTEFWIMNIYLPLGIALFHASNTQLLFIAKMQQKYTSHDYIPLEREKKQERRTWNGKPMNSMPRALAQRVMRLIAMAILAQLIISVLVFFLSRRFVPSFGIIGEDISQLPLQESRKLCRQGFEWLPSIFWQFFWAWIYAPYVLWSVRHIHDIHGWRVQTIFCCLVGLPASPMWLLALYLPQMANVSRYFIPPLWFVPSIFLMEFFMVFVPCWQIVRNRKLKKETLEILAEWERQKNSTSIDSDSTKIGTVSTSSHKSSIASGSTLRKAQSHLFTMTALERALQTNTTPLLMFAALRDFSGENISFLIAIQDWKRGWTSLKRSSVLQSPRAKSLPDRNVQSQQFRRAIEIYSTFVSPKLSHYPINISSIHLKKLEAVFEDLAASLETDDKILRNAATPFDEWEGPDDKSIEMNSGRDHIKTDSTVFEDNMSNITATTNQQYRPSVLDSYKTKSLDNQVLEGVCIPISFTADVFDDAVESIKYTVLTNTWPKFVNAGYAALEDNCSPLERFHGHIVEYRTGFSRLFSL